MKLLGAALVLVTILATGVAASQEGPAFERYKIPEPLWHKGWHNERALVGGVRKLQQPGVFYPGHSGSSSCNVNIVGTGKQFGVKSAKITCTTTDPYWSTSGRGGKLRAYAGKPLVDLSRSQPQNFVGITLSLPNEPDFLSAGNADPILFFVDGGKISFTGSVTNMHVVDWAVMHIENGTQASFNKMTFTSNHGERFPSIAAARSTISVTGCKFINNVCTNATRCHVPAVYVTEGERATINNNTFQGNQGHLAGAVMITSGALANVSFNVFTSNKATLYGTFGGAIFHDFCDRDDRTFGGRSEFRSNNFTNNFSNGFGGAIRLGSPDGGCPRTVVSKNLFKANSANLTGGAIHVSYCHGVRPQFYKNQFISNKAGKYNGQVSYNPLTYPAGSGSSSGKPTPSGKGCPQPLTTESTFSGTGTQKFSPPWFFL